MSWIPWLLVVACSRTGSGDPAQAPLRPTEFRGKVVISGSEPSTLVRLVTTSGNPELVGTLEPELRRLAGASVVVQGRLTGRRPVERLEVEDYQILEIDGEEPSAGVLLLRNGEVWLAGRDTLQLVGPPDELRSRSGAKVWIVGRRSGSTMQVQSYGVIRD